MRTRLVVMIPTRDAVSQVDGGPPHGRLGNSGRGSPRQSLRFAPDAALGGVHETLSRVGGCVAGFPAAAIAVSGSRSATYAGCGRSLPAARPSHRPLIPGPLFARRPVGRSYAHRVPLSTSTGRKPGV